jgi:CRISPR system Cascade subunit CasD
LDAGLRFGVRVEHPGRVVKDYQTVSGFLPTAEGTFRHSGVKTATSLTKLRSDPGATPATIVSPRFYLEDASFLIALEENDGFTGLLGECAAALQAPKWPIFLGRKACVPTRPVFESLTDRYDSIEDALKHYPWSWLGSCTCSRAKSPRIRPRVYVENVDGPLIRQDAVRINRARVYGFRYARELHGIEPEMEESDVPIQD